MHTPWKAKAKRFKASQMPPTPSQAEMTKGFGLAEEEDCVSPTWAGGDLVEGSGTAGVGIDDARAPCELA